MSFSFSELNLTQVATQSGSVIKPGAYQCEVTKAELNKTRTGGHQVVVTLSDVKGSGTIRHFINVHNPNSQKATEIGQSELKTLLVHGGHPTPDAPGDIKSLVGLKPGVRVIEDTYMKDGESRTGSSVRGYISPAEVGDTVSSGSNTSQSSASAGGDLDDNIPF